MQLKMNMTFLISPVLPGYSAQEDYGEDNGADQWVLNTSFVLKHYTKTKHSFQESPPGKHCQPILGLRQKDKIYVFKINRNLRQLHFLSTLS